jgi:hypothetical protein
MPLEFDDQADQSGLAPDAATTPPVRGRLQRAIAAKNEEAILAALESGDITHLDADTIIDLFQLAKELSSDRLMALVKQMQVESAKHHASSVVEAVLAKATSKARARVKK